MTDEKYVYEKFKKKNMEYYSETGTYVYVQEVLYSNLQNKIGQNFIDRQ